MSNNYSWVKTSGAVIRFDQHKIDTFNKEYRATKRIAEKHGEHLDYWSYFSYFFADELDGQTAYGFSILR